MPIVKTSDSDYNLPDIPIAAGRLSRVYSAIKIGESKSEQSEFAVKIMNYSPDENAMQKAKQEAQILQRLYPDVEVTTHRQIIPASKGAGKIIQKDEYVDLPVIIMPFLKGELLQVDQQPAPALATASFADRASYSFQYFDQLHKIHTPSSPGKPVVISDLGENVKIDFEAKELHLFDFGEALEMNSASLITLKRGQAVGENIVAASPEFRQHNQLGLVSDIYGSVEPIMLIWGAKNPGKDKRAKVANAGFNPEGLFEKIEPPQFVVALNELVHHFIDRMQQQDPSQRLQSALEGMYFFDILRKIENGENNVNDDAYQNAAILIAIASGHGNLFLMLYDYQNADLCRKLVNLYNDDPAYVINHFAELYPELNEIDYIKKAFPSNKRKIEDYVEAKEIVASHVINSDATARRMVLIDLIDVLMLKASQIKLEEFTKFKQQASSHYIDDDLTIKLFKEVSKSALRRRATIDIKTTSGSGDDLRNALTNPAFFKLAAHAGLTNTKKSHITYEDLRSYVYSDNEKKAENQPEFLSRVSFKFRS